MFRREILKSMGVGGTFGLLASSKVVAGATPVESASDTNLQRPVVGSIDLTDIPIIDTHLHQPAEMTYSQANEFWNASFVNPLLPSYEFPGRQELQSKLSATFSAHLDRLPREIGQRNYVARAYGVEPTKHSVDSVTAKHINKDFKNYIRSVFDRERIEAVVLQSDNIETERPKSLVPDDRFVWSYVVNHLIQPQWAKKIGAKGIDEVVASIHQSIETCVANGCVGLKIPIAYYRPLSIGRIDKAQANNDLQTLLKYEPTGYGSISQESDGEFFSFSAHPIYDNAKLDLAFRSYQDYLIKQIYVKAGELGIAVIIHSAVALHPSLRFEYNSPLGLYDILQDDEIKRVQTKFVLIHAGYPYHDYVAALLSQFPNVYADLSFFANFPGTLEEVLRTFLGLAPSEKILYGSDSSVPETTGYCAFNIRQVLARVLNDYQRHYGWAERDCETVIRNVLGDNAKRIFRIGA